MEEVTHSRSRRKQNMCRRERRAVQLPLDLLEDILHRLPSDDLLNFKLVCREWLDLISSPKFIEKHLERSKAECHEPRILVPCGDVAQILNCADIDITKTIPWDSEAYLLGSCDGLVLYYDSYEKKMGALSLSTGKHEVRTPNPSMENDIVYRELICSWFGRHPSTGKYVLVLANLYESEAKTNKAKGVEFNVHALSRDDADSSLVCSSTRELDRWVDLYDFEPIIGSLWQGRVHCPISLSSVEILAYDLEANDIIRIPTPLEHCHALGVADGYLFAVDESRVWMMAEYGVEESWAIYAVIDAANIGIHSNFCPNGDVISIDTYNNLTMFDIRAKENLPLKAFDSYTNRETIACVDSLVSPASVWT